MYYETQQSRRKANIILFICLILIISLLVTLNYEFKNANSNFQNNYQTKQLVLENETPENQENVVNNIEQASESIVGISKLKQNGTSIFLKDSEENLGIGSGIIVSENGYIITNQHVAGNKYSNCYVTLKNGESYNGNVVWADKNIDIAIVKISSAKLKYLKLGDSDKLQLAEEVYAIGNPIGFEFQRTVTKGIISGLNRTIRIKSEKEDTYMEDLIQTDATINEGNSGGALVLEDGSLIGINSIKISSAEGIGFAIPINIIKPIIEKLEQTGKFEEGYLGVYGYDKEVLPYLDSNLKFEEGIYVAEILTDGPLFKSNIKSGNIIKKIDKISVNKMTDLRKYIYTKSPGDIVTLDVDSGNKSFTISIKLGYKT